MNKAQMFPTIMIFLQIVSACGYYGEEPRKVVYWIAAAVLTASVTY